MKPHLFSWLVLAIAASSITAAPSAPSFRAVEIDSKIQIGYGLAVADVNGDAKPDVLLADKTQIVWYQNPTWTKHVIAEQLTPHDHVCIAAQDIDGDGKCEIAVGAGWNPSDTKTSGAVFYLIAPEDRTTKWEAVALPHEPTVHRMRWMKNASGTYDLLVVPLHGRDNKPATGEGVGVKILAYQKPDNPRAPWATQLWDGALHKTHNFELTQTDDDPGHEVLVGGKEGVFHLDQTDGRIESHRLTHDDKGGVGEVRSGKLAGGKRFVATVEPMHGNHLVVHVPENTGTDTIWSARVLDDSLVDAHALACADFAGAGQDQIVVGWRAMNRPGVKVGLKLFTALDPDGREWTQTIIDDNGMACEDLVVADLNGDGALDIVASGRATKNVKIYFNESAKR
jgi:hypothetical protein